MTILTTCVLVATLGADVQLPNFAALQASLPRLAGEVTVPGLAAPVTVERDRIGIPVIRGRYRLDVVRAQGFVHGQDRFFQMDLMRRAASGRLAELVGPFGAGFDRNARPHGFEHVAEGVLDRLDDGARRTLEAYAAGVNAGLGDLGANPPEYGVIGAEPEPWSPRDTVLVMLTMFDMLHFDAPVETSLGTMVETLPTALVDFLVPVDTRFEAPLIGDARTRRVPIPGPEIVDLRGRARVDDPQALVGDPPRAIGSNNWAIAGSRSVHGGAILANDPHLQITAPGIWYRAEMTWTGDDAGEAGGAGMGLTLPGSPGVVIGSNGRVAWGFTNTSADFQDLIIVEVDPDDPGRYRTPDGFERFGTIEETIGVRGAPAQTLTLRTTRWGVVTGEDGRGRPIVLKWTALDPAFVNVRIVELWEARTLEEAVETARAWYGPAQNVVIADDGGRIAWVVSGAFPRRRGYDGSVPVSWADGDKGWDGMMDESARPVLIDPPEGLLYTANNRTVGRAWGRRLGNAWDVGIRARRIRDRLLAKERLDERDMLDIQLDARVEVLDAYRDVLLEVAADDDRELFASAREIVASWDGTAGENQAAMVILARYRRSLRAELTAPLVAPCRTVDDDFRFRSSRVDEPVCRLLEERPEHLLPPGWASWPALLAGVLDRELERLVAQAPARGLERTWGEVNRAEVHHPLADAAPQFAALLNMPDAPLPGHPLAVRVATSRFGASARMVVSPGRESDGLLHIPAGQSGHPFSPHYRDSHPAWLEGLASPFRAVPTSGNRRLQLMPDTAD